MLIKVHIFPGVKEEEVVKTANDSFKVKVRALPENGMANARAKELLAFYFGVPEGKVWLVKGVHEPHKIFEIRE